MQTVQSVLGVAALAAVLVYWNFGTISPCGVLREAVRQRDDLAAVLPDSIVDLGLVGQYGALSPGRCLAILMTNLRTPVPNVALASRPKVAQPTAPAAIQQAIPHRPCRFGRLCGLFSIKPSKFKRLKIGWWAREGLRNPTLSMTYRVPPLRYIPLNSKAYF